MSNENEFKGQGGSYVVDPETQTLKLVERTKTALEVAQEKAASEAGQDDLNAEQSVAKKKGK